MFVKVCGITTEEDALVAIGMGADALGFNFVPGSSRQVRPSVARDIVRRLPGGVMTVGIFRDELKETVVKIANIILKRTKINSVNEDEDQEDFRKTASTTS